MESPFQVKCPWFGETLLSQIWEKALGKPLIKPFLPIIMAQIPRNKWPNLKEYPDWKAFKN